MSSRLFQLLFLFEICLIYSFGRHVAPRLAENDKLLCYSCKGSECANLDESSNKISCSGSSQLCWAGYVNNQPYRTCGNRYCTPRGISLDHNIRIETCCRSNLCNSVSLSALFVSQSRKTSPSESIELPTTTHSPVADSKNEETAHQEHFESSNIRVNDDAHNLETSFRLKPNRSDTGVYSVGWERIPYHRGSGNPSTVISSILLFLMPAALILLL